MSKTIMATTIFFLALFFGCEKKVDPVEHGKYLVTLGGCNDCHTPLKEVPGGLPIPDSTFFLSGHPEKLPYPVWTPEDITKRNSAGLFGLMPTVFAGPWGVSFASNLTSDVATGMGEWTEEAFIQALRTGKHQGQPDGRDLLPPMPWINLRQITDEDLKSMWAYLRTIPQIKNQVPLPVPPSGPTIPGK